MGRAGGVNLVSYWLRSLPPCCRLNRTRVNVFCRLPAAARGWVFRSLLGSVRARREMIVAQFLLREIMLAFIGKNERSFRFGARRSDNLLWFPEPWALWSAAICNMSLGRVRGAPQSEKPKEPTAIESGEDCPNASRRSASNISLCNKSHKLSPFKRNCTRIISHSSLS